MPYFAVGGGFYRARFEIARMGPADVDRLCRVAGATACYGMPSYGSMPAFYRQRMSVPAYGARWPEHRTFVDPIVAVGFGVRWEASERLFVAPDARALLVAGDGDSFAVGVFTLNVGYRF